MMTSQPHAIVEPTDPVAIRRLDGGNVAVEFGPEGGPCVTLSGAPADLRRILSLAQSQLRLEAPHPFTLSHVRHDCRSCSDRYDRARRDAEEDACAPDVDDDGPEAA